METTNKRRTPSQCRQWEKNRRNKFNDAVSRLGEIVKEINKALDGSYTDDTTQYPKIDIIEKAIVCLRRCSEEKTQMKADLVTLQVEIESFLKKKNSKDASTQVFINFRKDKQKWSDEENYSKPNSKPKTSKIAPKPASKKYESLQKNKKQRKQTSRELNANKENLDKTIQQSECAVTPGTSCDYEQLEANLTIQESQCAVLPGTSSNHGDLEQNSNKESQDVTVQQSEFDVIPGTSSNYKQLEANLTIQESQCAVLPGTYSNHGDLERNANKESLDVTVQQSECDVTPGTSSNYEQLEANLTIQVSQCAVSPGTSSNQGDLIEKVERHFEPQTLLQTCMEIVVEAIKRNSESKFMNIVMIKDKDSKRKALKEKSILTTNVIDKSSDEKSSRKATTESTPRSLPLLLPKISTSKKGPENTIVLLPAAPYILPQRPLLLPTMPPTFVLVDHLQTLNKSTFPITNRNNGDVTKTTTVNILPITAYSRPLSANKSKRSKIKPKINLTNKSVKTSKENTAVDKKIISNELSTSSEVVDNTVREPNDKEMKTGVNNHTSVDEKENSVKACDIPEKSENNSVILINTSAVSQSANIPSNQNPKTAGSAEVQKKQLNDHDSSNESTRKVCAHTDLSKKTANISDSSSVPLRTKVDEENNQSKLATPKQLLPEDKDKENKLPAILDATLCENTVDGGNARLELAEEFLAASPTAAFLMSFPLVSGNRAESPAEETQSQIQVKENQVKRNDTSTVPQIIPYFEKPNDQKNKSTIKANIVSNKSTEQTKFSANVENKASSSKTSIAPVITSNISNENPFLNLPMTSLISTSSGTVSDGTYLDFDCNLGKTATTQSTTYISNSNLFYKSDPFNKGKSSIYSTSNISSGHEFNSFGLYPCAMEKYTSKNKSDFLNVEDNLMKIGSSRLTYDIDLGWSHKGFDFVASTCAPTTFNKDNVLTTSSGSYASSYNPFNSEFHLPLTSTSNKKDNGMTKTSSSFADTITSFYSQPANLWAEDVPFYTNTNITKNSSKQQSYFPIDHSQPTNIKSNNSKSYDTKPISQTREETLTKSANMITTHQVPEKYTKKSPSKMHINWMTSEVRPMQNNNNCNLTHSELKGIHKSASVYGQVDHISKKQEHNDGNYFPISMSNFQQPPTQEELHIWPSTRQAGTTEVSIEPPPINLPTLVGDLALGPHDKKKTLDGANRGATQADIQHCSNLFSVTQLMNRSSDNNVISRYHGLNAETTKSIPTKHNATQAPIDNNRKSMSLLEHHIPEPCYIYNDSKTVNSYESNMNSYNQGKSKLSKSDKSSKVQKHSYSAEALIRGGSCSQKLQDSTRFIGSSQKYNDYSIAQDNSIAQVSHFPPLIDYSDNSYTGQQYSGTTLYNSTTNTITNSFYTNFIPGSSNIMSSNYGNGPFSSDFMDYNQTAECNYNHKYEEQKIRNNPSIFQQDKVPSNYKTSRRDSAAKHKLDCSKKESSKKYQSKRAKLNTDVDEWSDPNLLWQNKQTKRHSNLVTEELAFPNYVGNQMAGQYQPELFNGPLAPANVQGMGVGHNTDRSLANFAASSRTNFNLSTIFPEITMKVQ